MKNFQAFISLGRVWDWLIFSSSDWPILTSLFLWCVSSTVCCPTASTLTVFRWCPQWNAVHTLQLISLPVDSEPDYFKQRPMFWARCSFLFHTQVQQIHTQNRKGSLFSPKEISAVLLMLQRKNISQIFQFPASIIPAGGWKIWNSISLYQTRVIFLCFLIFNSLR